jgi:hypothetical protein
VRLCACHGLHASTRGHSILYIVRDLIAHIRQFKQFLFENLIFGLVRLLSIFLGFVPKIIVEVHVTAQSLFGTILVVDGNANRGNFRICVSCVTDLFLSLAGSAIKQADKITVNESVREDKLRLNAAGWEQERVSAPTRSSRWRASRAVSTYSRGRVRRTWRTRRNQVIPLPVLRK